MFDMFKNKFRRMLKNYKCRATQIRLTPAPCETCVAKQRVTHLFTFTVIFICHKNVELYEIPLMSGKYGNRER